MKTDTESEGAIQLVVTTDMNSLPAAIEFNYAELRGRLEAYLAKYDGLIVEEDGIRGAEEVRAEINRVAKAIARARIDTKRIFLTPFEAFEAKAKELEALCKGVEAKIAQQLAGFEERRRAEKLEVLRKVFATELDAVFPEGTPERKSGHWESFFASKTAIATKGNWLNKGCAISKAQTEIAAEVARCADVVRKVREVYAGKDAEILARAEVAARKAFDFGQAVTEAAQAERDREAARALQARREAEEEARRAAAARRAAEVAPITAKEAAERAEAAAAAHAARMAATVPPDAPAPAPEPQPETPPAPEEEIFGASFRVFGTRAQFQQLNDALNGIGVRWERIS